MFWWELSAWLTHGCFPTVSLEDWVREKEVERTWGGSLREFSGGSEGKVSACNVGDRGLIPGSGRSPGEGNGSSYKDTNLILGDPQSPSYLNLIASQRPHLWGLFLFSRSVVSYSLWPHGLQHTRLPCPSPSPVVCSGSCPSSWWCHPTFSSSVVPFSSCLRLSQHQGLFNESALRIRWSKYWSFSFSISPSKEFSGLISFRIDWFDLLAVKETLKSLL